MDSISNIRNFFTLCNGTKFLEGLTSTVVLTNEIGNEIFTRSFDNENEFKDFGDRYLSSFPGYSIASAAFIPPRTDNLHDLAKMFSSPCS